MDKQGEVIGLLKKKTVWYCTFAMRIEHCEVFHFHVKKIVCITVELKIDNLHNNVHVLLKH